MSRSGNSFGRLVARAFEQVLGEGREGSVAFVRCLSPDAVERLARDSSFQPDGWLTTRTLRRGRSPRTRPSRLGKARGERCSSSWTPSSPAPEWTASSARGAKSERRSSSQGPTEWLLARSLPNSTPGLVATPKRPSVPAAAEPCPSRPPLGSSSCAGYWMERSRPAPTWRSWGSGRFSTPQNRTFGRP